MRIFAFQFMCCTLPRKVFASLRSTVLDATSGDRCEYLRPDSADLSIEQSNWPEHGTTHVALNKSPEQENPNKRQCCSSLLLTGVDNFNLGN